jgi:diketogulonate reductase-like aldo/keto reductase
MSSLYRPIAFNGTVYDKGLSEDPYPTWKKLEELVLKGKIRNIGVSKCVEYAHSIAT